MHHTRDSSTRRTQPKHEVWHVDRHELRDTIRITVDRKLIDTLDRQRGSVSRSEYVEQVLTAALEREHPHLSDDWTPERAAERRVARLRRHLQTGR